MPTRNTITIELCDADRERLDRIGDLLDIIPDVLGKLTISETVELEAEVEIPEELVKVAEKAKPTVKLEDIQARVQKLATPSSGKRDAVRTLIKKYAERVTQIPADKYDEVMAELIALDEGR